MGREKKLKKIRDSASFDEMRRSMTNDMTGYEPKNDITGAELFCRVCGYQYEEEWAPWRLYDGNWSGSYDLCVCCNVQFGYEDESVEGVRQFRAEWIKNGAPFNVRSAMPNDWSYKKQLENIPENWQ